MAAIRGWLRRLVGFVSHRQRDSEFDRQLQADVEWQVEELRQTGMSADEARRVVLLKLGGIGPTRERYRDGTRISWVAAAAGDVRFAVRALWRNPGISMFVVAILATTVGANTAVYALIDRLFVRPLPYPSAERLVTIERGYRQGAIAGTMINHSGVMAFTVRDAVPELDVAIAGGTGGVNIVAAGHADYVRQQRVSAGFFRVFGVPPALGREFLPEEDRIDGPPVVILSHATWTRLFGGDRAVVGRTAMVRGEPHTIVGVTHESFRTLAPADIWTPLRPSTSGEGSGQNYTVVARMAPGTSFEAVDAKVRAVGGALLERLFHPPAGTSLTMRLVTVQDGFLGQLRRPSLLLWGAVGLVLLLGSANIAGLLLVRGWARTPEFATRMALGGGRAAIVRQVLVESAVLASCGWAAGVLLASALLGAAERTYGGMFGLAVTLEPHVLSVTFVAALVVSLFFGFLPAAYAARVDIRRPLAEGARSIVGPPWQWPARLLVLSEIALTLVLLVGAGLLLRTFEHLVGLHPGFDSTNVIAATASLQDVRYRTSAQVNGLFRESLERLRALPGVETAAVGLSLPYERPLNMGWRFEDDGESHPQPIHLTYVTPDYFRTLRTQVVRGRTFSDRDGEGATLVAVVNSTFVDRYSRDRDPVGRRLRVAKDTLEVVGVVEAFQVKNFADSALGPVAHLPGIFVPAGQMDSASFTLAHTWFEPSWIVRTKGESSTGVIPAMRAAVRDVDAGLSFNRFRTLDEVRDDALQTPRLGMLLSGALATMALVLATVGVFGLVSSSVVRRRRELSVRIALGASRTHVLKAASGITLAVGVAGVLVGLLVAWLGAEVMRSLVVGLSVNDLPTFVAVAMLLTSTVGAAAIWPALRLIGSNQAIALREL